MASPTNERTVPRIKGSWEELLQRAQRLAANRNDEALEIYDKLISRLSKLPRAQRMANEGRLQNILIQAGVNAQAYLNASERYDEALNVLAQIRDVVDEDDAASLDLHRSEILLMAGRTEDAVALLRRLAEEGDNDIEDLGTIFFAYLRQEAYDKAAEMLTEMEQQVAERGADPTENADAAAADQAYLDYLRALLALEQEQWQTGIDWFEQAVAANPDYAENYNVLYTRLVHGGQYEQALPFIQRDAQRRIRSTFWHAVALYHLDQPKEAERLWKRVTETELTEEEARNFFEVVLSFYYLGDPQRMGLELVLRLLNEVRNPSWSVFFLAGLGWALRNNLRNARTNFDIALQQRRVAALGGRFTSEVKLFVQDLLDEETQQQLATYFDFVQSEDTAPESAEQTAASDQNADDTSTSTPPETTGA